MVPSHRTRQSGALVYLGKHARALSLTKPEHDVPRSGGLFGPPIAVFVKWPSSHKDSKPDSIVLAGVGNHANPADYLTVASNAYADPAHR